MSLSSDSESLIGTSNSPDKARGQSLQRRHSALGWGERREDRSVGLPSVVFLPRNCEGPVLVSWGAPRPGAL